MAKRLVQLRHNACSTSCNMIEVREINQIEGLDEFRRAWQALLAQTPGASFFHSCDWLECYWKHFAAGQRLRVLVVTENRRPVGIVPLVVRTESTRVGRLRMLTYPLQDWATFYGPIGPNPSSTLVAGLRHVRQTPRDWDVLDLRWVDAMAPTKAALSGPWPKPASTLAGQKWDRTSLVELPETWQAYWHGREAKFRKNIDGLQRRMAGQGKMELVRYRPEPACEGEVDPRWDLYDTCVRLPSEAGRAKEATRRILATPRSADTSATPMRPPHALEPLT